MTRKIIVNNITKVAFIRTFICFLRTRSRSHYIRILEKSAATLKYCLNGKSSSIHFTVRMSGFSRKSKRNIQVVEMPETKLPVLDGERLMILAPRQFGRKFVKRILIISQTELNNLLLPYYKDSAQNNMLSNTTLDFTIIK